MLPSGQFADVRETLRTLAVKIVISSEIDCRIADNRHFLQVRQENIAGRIRIVEGHNRGAIAFDIGAVSSDVAAVSDVVESDRSFARRLTQVNRLIPRP